MILLLNLLGYGVSGNKVLKDTPILVILSEPEKAQTSKQSKFVWQWLIFEAIFLYYNIEIKTHCITPPIIRKNKKDNQENISEKFKR